MKPRLGSINYINTLPVMYDVHLPQWSVVAGPPSELNALLADGALDASPISSIEYARHQDDYLILPDLSISSRGAVRSVMLFSRLPLEELHGQSVGICRATATSRVLLRILLEDYVKVLPRYVEDATLAEARKGHHAAVLLIGDEALALRAAARTDASLAAWHAHDLGDLWRSRIGLPMVFAVWAVRRDRSALASSLVSALHASRDAGVRLPSPLLEVAAERTGMTFDELRTYYGGLHYTMGAAEREALLTFYRHAAQRDLCPPCPTLHFWPEPSAPVTVERRHGSSQPEDQCCAGICTVEER